MHVKQYLSRGQAIFDCLGNSGRKDPDTMFTRKKDPDPKRPFSKDTLSGAFSKSSVLGPERFQKLRIRADTCDRFYVSGVEKLRFRKDSDTCAHSLRKNFGTHRHQSRAHSTIKKIQIPTLFVAAQLSFAFTMLRKSDKTGWNARTTNFKGCCFGTKKKRKNYFDLRNA